MSFAQNYHGIEALCLELAAYHGLEIIYLLHKGHELRYAAAIDYHLDDTPTNQSPDCQMLDQMRAFAGFETRQDTE